MSKLVVASCKPWHYAGFERIASHSLHEWCYVSTPDELRNALNRVQTPRYLFFLHWNWMVERDIWENHECVCFHMTDLPYGRGGSPLQNLILDGKSVTHITALRMVDEMDAGPIYAKRPMSLEGRAEDIYLRAGVLCWELIDWILVNQPTPKHQEGKPTYFKRRKPEQSLLPITGTLTDVYNHIRMLDAPTYPLAFVDQGDFRVEFTHARLLDDIGVEARVVIRRRSQSE